MNDNNSAEPRFVMRKPDVVEVGAEGDVLIYDPDERRAYRLNQAMGQIWRRCEGSTSESAMAAPEDTVSRKALGQLIDNGLLVYTESPSPANGVSRGTFMRTGAAAVVGGAVALPLIQSIVIPSGASAATACVPIGACGPSDQNKNVCCVKSTNPDGSNNYGVCFHISGQTGNTYVCQ